MVFIVIGMERGGKFYVLWVLILFLGWRGWCGAVCWFKSNLGWKGEEWMLFSGKEVSVARGIVGLRYRRN